MDNSKDRKGKILEKSIHFKTKAEAEVFSEEQVEDMTDLGGLFTVILVEQKSTIPLNALEGKML